MDFKRINAKKLKFTYDTKIEREKIQPCMEARGLVEKMEIEFHDLTSNDPNLNNEKIVVPNLVNSIANSGSITGSESGKVDKCETVVYVQYDRKLNILTRDKFAIQQNGVDVVPQIQSFVTFPNEVPTATKNKRTGNGKKTVGDEKPEIKTLSRDVVLQTVVSALTERDDEQYITILKEDPCYQLLEKLNLSVYHGISIIIYGLYVAPEFQEAKLNTVKNRLCTLKYLKFGSETALKQSILELNPADTRHLLNVIRGVE